MFKKLTILISIMSLLFLASCSSKKKNPNGVSIDQSPITTLDGNQIQDIQTDGALTFDSRGSDSGSIDGLISINFPYDTSTLSSEAKDNLQQNASWIKNNQGVTVLVEGHCDQRGSVEYNLALGERRAESVKNYMIGLGVDPSRLSIVSYGKEKLIDYNDAEASLGRNRRANFVPIK